MMLRVAIAQLNLLVGDIQRNADSIFKAVSHARDEKHAHAVVFSELTLVGYPPEDLLLREDFLGLSTRTLHNLARKIKGIDVILGFPEKQGHSLYNSIAVLRDHGIHTIYRKQVLPNYGVFDEKRYFTAGDSPCVFNLMSIPIAVSLCEDIWQPGVVEKSAQAGAKLLLNLNASPFHAHKIRERETVLRERIAASHIPIVYVNQVGGQDELVFDGASFVMDANGKVVHRAPEFEEAISFVDFDVAENVFPIGGELAPIYEEVASDYKAIVLAIRDYVIKNGFQGAVLGLSGGIDSALTLALAVDALGCDQIEAVLMPSRYTAAMSIDDAKEQANAMNVTFHLIPIEPAFQAFGNMLEDTFTGMKPDTTEENIQARCRGVILMAISNKKRKLLLTTGNKSEMSVGYATLYGDMAGGFAPLKDVPKQLVYKLAKYRNNLSPVIPTRVIERPPSAELAPDQIDEDSLPPYSVLDRVLAHYVEQDKSIQEIIAEGFREEDVLRVVRLVDNNEYKRRQAPPGVRITPRAFGRDRRYPITSGFDPDH